MAGLIALVQTDIKRVIAYSTMSQIGYMFLGAGIGAYANAMFHLMTHAFFKALLFLGAGIVIHALAGEQDIRKMGGLRKLMPKTWWAMLIGGARARRDPAALRVLLEGLDPGLGARGRHLREDPVRGRDRRRVPDRALHVPDAVRRLRRRAVGVRRRSTRRTRATTGSSTGRWRCRSAVLAVLAVIGGWIQFADAWTPITDWLEPVAKPLVEAIELAGGARQRPRRLVGARGHRRSRGGSTRRTG